MSDRAWRIGRIAGIDIKIHYSWLFIAFLLAWALWIRVDFLYDEPPAAEVALAVGVAVLFFGSVLVHELAHSLVALSRGIPVQGITLFLFGGATEAQAESKTARDELAIAVVGPLTSLALAGLLGIVANVGDPATALFGMIGYLAWVNLALAVFNMLPGLPLDGGRVFRAVAWWITGDKDKATHWAAAGGSIVGYGLIALGVLSILGGGIGGLWLVALGWLLSQAARTSEVQQQMETAFRGVAAGRVGSHPARLLPAELSVAQAVDDYFLRFDHTTFPITQDGQVTGLVTLAAVRAVPPEERTATHVGALAVPLDHLIVVDADTPMSVVVNKLQGDTEVGRALVRHPDGSVGIISPRDIRHYLQRAAQLGVSR